MTISQRYGLFTVVPGIILMLMIGLFLVTKSEDPEPDDAADQSHEAVEVQNEPIEQGERGEYNKGAVDTPDSPPHHANRESAIQLAYFAQQATLHVQKTQPEPATNNPQPIFNTEVQDSENSSETDRPPQTSKEIIQQAFQALKPSVKACYETLLADFPEASGKLSMNFVFETENGVSRLQTAEPNDDTTLFDRQLHDCVAESASTIELPEIQESKRLAVTYPFNFQSNDAQ